MILKYRISYYLLRYIAVNIRSELFCLNYVNTRIKHALRNNFNIQVLFEIY